jgi:hypothetical protein
MTKLCSNCHFIGAARSNFWGAGFYYGIFLILIGLIGLFFDGQFIGSHTLYLIGAIFIIVSGILKIFAPYIGYKTCPKCNDKDMLSLDDPKAINLIKKYNLKVGENPTPSSQNEPGSSSLETPKL